jgi:segregation and condensation protein A
MSAEPDRTSSFTVELPVFRGPFRALTDLILDQKVDVCDVPIARVTEEFLHRSAEEVESWDLEEATWFVAACAMLLELKVGRLMPRHEEPDEDDILGVSPDLLYARSLELAAFREATLDVSRLLEEASRSFPRTAGPPPEFSHLYPDVLEGIRAGELASIAAAALRPPPGLDLSHVTPITFTVADAIEMVTARLGESGAAGAALFRELVAECEDRIQVVVSFLALLELYRDGKVDLSQAETFGEIQVRWNG